MADDDIRKQIELEKEVHEELTIYKVRRGHKSFNEAIDGLLKEVVVKAKQEDLLGGIDDTA